MDEQVFDVNHGEEAAANLNGRLAAAAGVLSIGGQPGIGESLCFANWPALGSPELHIPHVFILFCVILTLFGCTFY